MPPLTPRSLALLVLPVALLVAGVMACFALVYVGAEDPIYTWDYGNYWNQFQAYGAAIKSGASWYPGALSSVRNDDYNPVAAILLYPFYALWGGGRAVYVSAISVAYLMPAALVAAVLAVRVGQIEAMSNRLCVFVLAVLYVPFWAPSLRGMVDVVGLVPLGLASLLILRPQRIGLAAVNRSVLIGLLLWTAFLCRRWYAYVIVVVFALQLAVQMQAVLRHDRSLRSVGIHALPSAISGLVFLALALAVQWNLVARIATTDYSNAHASYSSPLVEQALLAAHRLGPLFAALAGLGAVATVRRKNIAGRFCVGASLGTFLLFASTQRLGPHHFLPIAFFLFPLYVLGAWTLVGWLFQRLTWPVLTPIVCLGALAFLFAVTPIGANLPEVLGKVLPEPSRPLKLENESEYQRLLATLRDTVEDGERVAVFASSLVLSDELLLVLDPALDQVVLRAAQDPLRHTVDFELLRAKYALVTTPEQSHLAAGAQEQLLLPNRLIIRGEGMGAAYQIAAVAFQLTSDVRAVLYARTREPVESEMQDFMSRLALSNRNWKERPQVALSVSLATRTNQLGDRYGAVRHSGINQLFIHPGATGPTRISFPLLAASDLTAVRLAVRGANERCSQADGIRAAIYLNDELHDEIVVLPGKVATLDVTPAAAGHVELQVGNNENPYCDYLTASFLP